MTPKKKIKPRDGAPIGIDAKTWLYVVERPGMTVVHDGKIFYIPWAKVRLALQEKEARS